MRGEEIIVGNSNIIVVGENLFDNDSLELYLVVYSELVEGNFFVIILDVENVNLVFEDLVDFLVENLLLNVFFCCFVGFEICYICSRRKLKEFMRSVYIRL